MAITKVQSSTSHRCSSLPVNGYAFHFLDVLREIHSRRENFSPVPLQEILDLLPEEFRECNPYEEIEVLYDQEIIESYYGKGFFVTEEYR